MKLSRSGSGLTGISKITSGIGQDLLIHPPSKLTFFGGEHGEFAVICLGCLISFANRNFLRIPYLTNHCWQISGFSLHEQNLKVKLYYLSSGRHHTALFCFSLHLLTPFYFHIFCYLLGVACSLMFLDTSILCTQFWLFLLLLRNLQTEMEWVC